MHKGPCLRFLSSGGLGISVIEASGSVTGHLVRGILGKSDVEMRGGLNWLRIVSGGGFFVQSLYSALCHYDLVTGSNKQFYSILNY